MRKLADSLQRNGGAWRRKRAASGRRKHARRVTLESLEDRFLLTSAGGIFVSEFDTRSGDTHLAPIPGDVIRLTAEGEHVVPDFIVTTADDEDDPSPLSDLNDLSLREAIGLANANLGASIETIGFDETLFATPQTISLSLGELAITDGVRIDGPGSALLTIDGNQQSRVLDVPAGSFDVLINGLRITRGQTSGNNETAADRSFNGGGIRFLSAGTLAVENAIISDNSTTGDYASGGGIFSSGNLTITASTITGNSTDGIESGFGGAIESYGGNLTISGSTISGNSTAGNNSHGGAIDSFNGDLTITGSTISGNRTTSTTADGGGIYAAQGVVTITNSTISGNTAARNGGGLSLNATGRIINATITDNDAVSGGGVHADSTGVNLIVANSILAGNRSTGTTPDLLAAASTSVFSSLIGEREGSGLPESQTPDPETGNLVGSAAGGGVIDPKLEPLSDNGGSTNTHALLVDSPAIDAGDGSLLPLDTEDLDGDGETGELIPFDQRGATRVVDIDGIENEVDGLDIGAYERAAAGLDFGDAPLSIDTGFANDYPVTLAQDGARHLIGSLFLGELVDAELDGQPDDVAGRDGAGGDDLVGSIGDDDEDGILVIASAIAIAGSETTSSFSVIASEAGKLDAWIDFDHDGIWSSNERIIASVDVVAGENVLSYPVPAGASVGDTGARFRLTSNGINVPTGSAPDGEVEDYLTTLLDGGSSPDVNVDLVDAATTVIVVDEQIVVRGDQGDLFSAPIANLGQLHLAGSDSNDFITLDASGGRLIPPAGLSLDGGDGSNTLRVIGAAGTLDFANDEVLFAQNFSAIDLFDPAATPITLDAATVTALSSSTTLVVRGSDGDTIIFRDADDWRMGDTSFVDGRFIRSVTNVAGGQETIDTDLPHAWQNVVKAGDVNNNGDVTAGDALIIINELARRSFSDPISQDLDDPSVVPAWPALYYDQNGDDRATALDALRVINELARIANSQSSENEFVGAALVEETHDESTAPHQGGFMAKVGTRISKFDFPVLPSAVNEVDLAEIVASDDSKVTVDAIDELLSDQAFVERLL